MTARSRLWLTLICLSFPFCVSAQKEKVVEAAYTYIYSSDITPKAARLMAYERAQIEAIREAFPGTITAENHSLVINDSEKGSSSRFYTSGVSEVKGEWLGDTREPEYTDPVFDSAHDLWSITCKVKGRVRETVWAKPAFRWQLMRNHVEDASETDQFVEDDQLYMTFQAPCDGYLAVYLSDERGMAQCLVPNDQDPAGIYRVQGGKRYVFFSDRHPMNDGQMPTEEFTLFPAGEVEYDQFYVFFSPNVFRKAANGERQNLDINGTDRAMPGEVPYADFQHWQLKLLSKDKELQREKKIISISRKKK